MSHIALYARRLVSVAALTVSALISGCGGGGSTDVLVVASQPLIALGIVLTRIGPQTVQVDWSDNPAVDYFTVSRNGSAISNVRTTTLIDRAVVFDVTYCYQVFGYDRAGNLIAQSDGACLTIL